MIRTGQNTTYAQDYQMGIKNEIDILPKLRTHFNDETITKTENRYTKYDWTGKNGCKYEMKSRRNSKMAYPTSYFPCHKVIDGVDQVFIIKFTDKDCFIKYNKTIFDTFKTQMLMDYRVDKNGVIHNHFCIPVTSLIDF